MSTTGNVFYSMPVHIFLLKRPLSNSILVFKLYNLLKFYKIITHNGCIIFYH